MKQLPFLAIFLSLLTGISACAPTAEPTQKESPAETRSKAQKELAAATQEEAPSQNSSESPVPAANTESPGDLGDGQCDSTATQQEMNLCAQERYQQADEQLNSVYQALKRDVSDSGQQALTTAELAWIEFRDRNCTFAKNQFIGGSIVPLIYNSCLETHTAARIAELQQTQRSQVSYQSADAQLNETYQDLLAILSAPETEDMTDIQLAWIEYRDRNCTFESLHSADVIEESQCLARMSEARTAQLKQDIDQRSL